jgi:hypothetical protein
MGHGVVVMQCLADVIVLDVIQNGGKGLLPFFLSIVAAISGEKK